MSEEKGKIKLISILIIALLVISINVPILAFFVAILFSVLRCLSNKNYSFLFFVFSVVFLSLILDFEYAINFSLIYVLPGIFIGSISKKQTYDKNANKLEAIFGGTIFIIFCFILSYFVNKYFFDFDLISEFKVLSKEAIDLQFEVMKQSNISFDNFTKDLVFSTTVNLISYMIILQSIVYSLFIYYTQVFILSKMKYKKTKLAKLSEFYLPKNISTVFFVVTMSLVIIDASEIWNFADVVLMNFQLFCITLIVIEGISVSIFYIKKWNKEKNIKNMFLSFLAFSLLGVMLFMGLGIVDEMIDSRKLRHSKSV